MTVAAVPWSDVAERLRPFVARRVPPSEVDARGKVTDFTPRPQPSCKTCT